MQFFIIFLKLKNFENSTHSPNYAMFRWQLTGTKIDTFVVVSNIKIEFILKIYDHEPFKYQYPFPYVFSCTF